jgi:signal transduction histidine kinase
MRRRLMLLSAAMSLLITVAFVVPLAFVVRQLAHDRAITRAESDAQVLALSLTVADDDLESVARSLTESEGLDLRVILPDMTVIGGGLQLGEDISQPLQGTAGRAVLDGGEAVYAPALGPAGISVVRIFVPEAELREGVTWSWVVLALLGATLVMLAVALSDRFGRALRGPIDALVSAARRIGSGDLDVRVEPAGPPDIAMVGAQFNTMAEEVGHLLQREREMAADLSHRLRTPMMTLRLGIDGVDSEGDRERLLDDMAKLEQAVDSVIEQTRRPHDHTPAATPLVSTLRERVAFWQALADEQARATSFEATDGDFLVGIREPDLVAAFDALFGNIFTHTDEGTPYAVTAHIHDRIATIAIEDAGPGIPPSAAARGVSGAGSTGLGLDIVHRIVSDAGGQAVISESPLGGARVRLTLPGTPA